MSSTTIVYLQLIILISKIISIPRTFAASQCDYSSAIHLQSAVYIYSLILRVQPLHLSEQDSILREVLVREVIKISTVYQHPVKMNDVIIIRINASNNAWLDDSCWDLLRVSTVDVIIFLNGTIANQFDLHYPPIESTLRVRQHIDAVLHYETYAPQVLIKTRLDNGIISKDYSLQCNSRGNPLPRLRWSKKTENGNGTVEYYPLSKQCQSTCRVYSIQNKYQSILYFQPLTSDDSGIYICHAENPMNRTTTSIYLNLDHPQSNERVACASLQDCTGHGKCLMIENQWKCLCDNGYFGEQCKKHYQDIVKEQDNAYLLFKSRFLAGFILVLVGFLLVSIALLSWCLARNNREQRKRQRAKSPAKPLISPVKDILSPIEPNDIIPSSPIKQTTKPPPATVHISHSPMLETKPLPPPMLPRAIRRESSTATDDDDEDGINSVLRHYQTLPPVPTKIDEEYEERFSLKMNRSEELGLGCLTNGTHSNDLISSHGYAEIYQPNHQTGLIKPLNIRKDPPQRYTKYVSSYSKFVLPRPIPFSSSEYQPR